MPFGSIFLILNRQVSSHDCGVSQFCGGKVWFEQVGSYFPNEKQRQEKRLIKLVRVEDPMCLLW